MTPYGRSALAGVLADLNQRSGTGGRNAAMFVAAVRLFELVAAGELTEAQAEADLLAWADRAELHPAEVRSILQSARRRAQPRGPERQARHPWGALRRGVTDAPQARPAPTYPNPGKLRELWSATIPIIDDDAACSWLRSRCIEPDRLDVLEASAPRVLQPEQTLPHWAWGPEGSWLTTRHRLLVPTWGVDGRHRSVRARHVAGSDGRKELAPRGYTTVGLVTACPLARLWLTGDEWAAGELARLGLRICEGVPRWLRWSSSSSDADEDAPATIGIWAGSWTEAFAAKIPNDCQVIIATDFDPTGDRYAQHLAETLDGRVRAGELPAPMRHWPETGR